MLGSVSLTWNGATKLFFVNRCGAKVNAQHLQTIYKQHLQKELLSAVQHLCIHKDWISEQCTIQTSFKIFYKMHSIHVLSKYMNDPPPHLVAIPSIFYLE